MMFYLLSLVTGILECGWIAIGAVRGLPLWQILCYPLSYHLGNLFPKPISLSKRCLSAITAGAFASGSLTLVDRLSENTKFVLTCISIFLLSTVIQSVRSGLKTDGNKLLKRIFRVGGFAIAPFATIVPSAILIVSCIITFFCLKGHKSEYSISNFGLQKGFSLVMIFHQLHYFFYAHITLASVSLMLTMKTHWGTVFAALLFCGTWVTYLSVEPIVSMLTSKTGAIFYAGHIGIGILLLSMSLISYSTLFIVLWLVTGLGGGVVYTISAKAKETGSYRKDHMTTAENIGHTLGLLTAVCTAFFCGNNSPRIMLVFGSVSAIMAVISMMFISGKENLNENIYSKS